MGDDIGSGSVTDCHLRSFFNHRRHTQQCRAAPQRKSIQTQPEPMSSPINYPAYFWHLWFWFSSTSNILWPHCVSAALWGPQQQILFFLSGTILKKWREKWKISQSERVTSYRWLVTAKIISLNLVLFPVTWLWALKSSFLSFDHESVRLRRCRGGLLQVNNF